MSNKKKSIKNLIFLTLSQAVTIAVSILLPRLYMVEYGSEINGLLSSLHQFLIYMGLFEAGIGATTLQALYGPVGIQDWESVSHVLSATNYYYKRTSKLYLTALLVLTAVYPVIVRSELNNYFFVAGVVFFSGIGNVFLFRFQGVYKLLLQADGKNYVVSNVTTILNVCINLVKIYLISTGWNVVAVLASTLLIQLVQIAYMMIYTKRTYNNVSIAVEPNFAALEQRNYTLVHQICEMLFQHTDVIILTFVCGLKTVSVYSLYKLIFSHLDSIFRIVTNSVSFALGQIFQRDLEKYKKHIDLFEMCYSAAVFAILSVTLFLLLPFIKLYTNGITDAEYADERLAVLFVTISLLTHVRVPMQYTINYAGHFKATMPQSLIETIINLVVSIIGVHYLGIYGVLLGTVVALLYRTNDIICYSNKKILKRRPWKSYFVLVVNFMLFVFLQFIYGNTSVEITNYSDFLLVGCWSTGISISIYFCVQVFVWPGARIAAKSVWLKCKSMLQ